MDAQPNRIGSWLPAIMLALFVLHFVCLGAIMFFFMGGSADTTLGHTLHATQVSGIALSSVAIVAAGIFFSSRGGLRALYDYTPRWLLFAVFVIYCVVAVGELSFLVLSRYVSTAGNDALHVSLVCLWVAPTAFTAILAVWQYAVHGTPFDKARW